MFQPKPLYPRTQAAFASAFVLSAFLVGLASALLKVCVVQAAF